ncbi:hypothetical protein [Nostocoides vanveenii]|uniref:hypothetical protein n=1 Tax=Nostocoides vanveenii TaxID=330835 RepID=UPI0031D4D2EB
MRIRFEGEDAEGREEWVPPARLKVPWADAETFVAREQRWDAVCAPGPRNDDAEAMAAETVFDLLVPLEVAAEDVWGVIRIRDVAALSELSGLPADDLTGHPVSFEEDGEVVAPWPVKLAVAQALARRMPDRVLSEIAEEERRLQDELIHGFRWRRRDAYRDLEQEVAIVREQDENGYRQSRELRRAWCGVDAVDRWDELTELRKEIHRVGLVAEDAIAALRKHGHSADADRLAMALGETVEMLRVQPD